jgi:hypothetical protein
MVRGRGPDDPVPPGWEAHPVGMEELVLAYLRGDARDLPLDSAASKPAARIGVAR